MTISILVSLFSLYRYFSSVCESEDGNELICALKGLSVLGEIVLDVVDVVASLNKLNNRYTLTPDNNPSIFQKACSSISSPIVYSV